MSEITAGELAARLGLVLRGEAGRLLTGAATLEDAGPDELAFAGGPKYFEAAAHSAAGCIIATPEFAGMQGQTIIQSAQPRAHFAQALALLYPAPGICGGIDPSAVIEAGARIDESAEVGAFVTIGRKARVGARARIGAGSTIGASTEIGDDCVVHPRVSIYERITIGARCLIHSGAVIGADGFGFEMAGGAWNKVPQVGTITIGDDVEIGANSCIDRATLGATVIGDGTKLDNMVHIGHNCRIGKHVVIAAQTGLAGGVSIGDYAVVGGQVGVGDKARIESKAIVGWAREF